MSIAISSQNFANLQLFDGVRSNTNPSNEAAPEAAPVLSDAQVVSKVASTEIKPSNVGQAAQPLQSTVEEAARQMQDYVRSTGRNLSFSVDQNTGYQVVQVVNADTGELIRQMPSPEFLKLSQSFPHTNTGLINQTA